MFVFQLVEKEISEVFVAEATVQPRQAVRKTMVKNVPVARAKSQIGGTKKVVLKGIQTKKQLKKEVPQPKSYVEESVVKDASWNIYTGNPGIYVTEGDGLNFGTVSALPDSVFIKLQQSVATTTIRPYGIVGKELIIPNQDGILSIILVLWIIFASVRVGFLNYLEQIMKSLVNFADATRLYQQRGYKTMYGAVRLDFIFHLILPLSVYQMARFYDVDIPGYPAIILFLGLLLIINGYLFTKILLYRLAGSIVMLKEQTEESIFNIKLYYKALGLFLLPVVTIHAVLAETNFITIWVMAGMIIIMYLAALVRSIYVGNKKDVSIFYLILYLCTLEILPLLLIFKLMSSE